MEKKIYGIDISKDTLQVSKGSQGVQITIPNNIKAIDKFVKILLKEKVDLVVVESTGGYEMLLVDALWSNNILVSVVNPKKIWAFSKSLGCEAKTDKIDAKIIALFGEKMSPRVTVAPRKEIREMQILQTRRNQLNQILVIEKNHLKAPLLTKEVMSQIKQSISLIKKQIAAVDDRINSIINSVSELKEKRVVIEKIIGAGPVLTTQLISNVPELGTVNRRKIAALIGLAPFNDDSGTFYGKRRISGGRTEVRCVLYMATMAAIRHNQKIKSFYLNLLAKGKQKMIAFVAAMRKFIILINSSLKQFLLTKQNINALNT